MDLRARSRGCHQLASTLASPNGGIPSHNRACSHVPSKSNPTTIHSNPGTHAIRDPNPSGHLRNRSSSRETNPSSRSTGGIASGSSNHGQCCVPRIPNPSNACRWWSSPTLHRLAVRSTSGKPGGVRAPFSTILPIG